MPSEYTALFGHSALPMHPQYCNSKSAVPPPSRDNGLSNMIREMALATRQNLTAETVLWRGVIARTIRDWLSKPLRPKREAERYLFEKSADLSSVCASAGIDVGRLRTCLNKVRGRTLLDLLPIAA